MPTHCPACGYENAVNTSKCDICDEPLEAQARPKAAATPVSPTAQKPKATTAAKKQTPRPQPITATPTSRVVQEPQHREQPAFSAGIVTGTVAGFQERSERGPVDGSQTVIWTFRVDEYDETSACRRRVPVELRGTSIRGSVRDGDKVEINQMWREGETLSPTEFKNLSTNSIVRVKGQFVTKWGVLVALAIFLLIAFLGYYFFIRPSMD